MVHVLLDLPEFDARIPGRDNCVFWRDDLSFGPVPTTDTLEELTRVREMFWDSMYFGLDTPSNGQPTSSMSSLSIRDKQIHGVIESQDEVVLWSGLNRREILMLGAALRFFLQSTRKLTLVQCPGWGPLSCNADDLARFFVNRSRVSPQFAVLLLELWEQYSSPKPLGWNQLINRLQQERDPLQAVVQWIAAEYPSVKNGLSRVEEALLRNSVESATILRVVARTMATSEDLISDIQLYAKLLELLTAETPAFEIPASSRDILNNISLPELRALRIQPTVLGRELLRGNSDYVALNGIDRWVGGVHLKGEAVPWRFDSSGGYLVAATG
jgi:hypothetical protein